MIQLSNLIMKGGIGCIGNSNIK